MIDLKEGDILVYKSHGFFGWVVSLKTWHKISHVEMYAGDNVSIGSVFKTGVHYYKTSFDNLYGIYRPVVPYNFENARKWFIREAVGQKYDWKGILGFLSIVKGGDRSKQFCSELVTRLCRQMGFDPFPNEDADKIAPFQFIICPLLKKVY